MILNKQFRFKPGQIQTNLTSERVPGGSIMHEGVHDESEDQLRDGGRRLKGLLSEARRDSRVAERPKARIIKVVGEQILEHWARGGKDFHHPQLRVYVVGGGCGVLEAG